MAYLNNITVFPGLTNKASEFNPPHNLCPVLIGTAESLVKCIKEFTPLETLFTITAEEWGDKVSFFVALVVNGSKSRSELITKNKNVELALFASTDNPREAKMLTKKNFEKDYTPLKAEQWVNNMTKVQEKTISGLINDAKAVAESAPNESIDETKKINGRGPRSCDESGDCSNLAYHNEVH